VTVRFAPEPPKTILALGTKAVFELPLVRARLAGAVSASPMLKLSAAVALSSLIIWSGISEMLGGVFAGETVTTNVSDAINTPSLTVTVIVAAPVWPGAGVTVTERLAPVPPKTIFTSGTRVGFEELPLKLRLLAVVSISAKVKLIGPSGVLMLVN
jgi:hypothetical protein